VIGAGTMGAGIGMAFLSAGLAVTILDTSQEALDRGIAQIRRTWESGVVKGRITRQDLERYSALLTPTLDYDALRGCDLIVEAVFELMEVKQEVLGRVDAVAKADAIIATNTSYLDVDAIALATSRPEQVIGLHFFSPANVMKLLEIVRGARTAPDVLVTAMALAKRIGKIPVISGNCYGFIGNRMLARRREQAFDLLMEGATVQQIDEALVAFGLPMGPFQMSDLAGVDIGWHRDPSRIETVRDALCAAGRFGQKAGKGYYDYDESRKAAPSPEAQAIIAAFAARAGHRVRSVGPDEIRERCLFAMVNEGASILAEGIAQRASDIDVVWINGYGWPKHTGGPMFWAEQVGLGRIVERLKSYRIPVAALLAEKARLGERFDV
jgi:3-hydroxyacyl-CoA dehydrogenase